MSIGLDMVKRAAPFAVRYNTDSIMDVFSGRWQSGLKGETIINGGIATFTGAVAGPNMYKSTILASQQLMALENYPEIHSIVYECEGTGEALRWQELAMRTAPNLAQSGLEDSDRLIMTNLEHYNGNEFWGMVKDIYKLRIKQKDKLYKESPFKLNNGTALKVVPPIMIFIDSLSAFRPESMENIQNKGEIGDSSQNMLYMKGGIAKSQMLDEAPAIMHRGGLFILATGQLGKKFDLGAGHTPDAEKLRHMADNVEMKGVSRQFQYLPNNLFWIAKTKPLVIDGKTAAEKLPMYPTAQDLRLARDTDLMVMSVMNVRGKAGPSGMPLELIFSQREGFLKHLTDYHMIAKTKVDDGYYGMTSSGSGGSIRKLTFYPDVSVSRTTIREKLDTDSKLRRACQLTRDLLMLEYRFGAFEGLDELICSPETLYESLRDKGYNWNELLDTRGYWTFDQYTHPVPYLSVVDLLKMRAGLYHPYWMKPL